MNSEYPIRYPVGYHCKNNCIGAISNNNKVKKNTDLTLENDINNFKILNYIESRKEIYVPLYCKLVKSTNRFKELQERLNNGENLLICEIDVAYQESLDYYKEKYKVDNNFIKNYTMDINEKNINIMLNDDKHPFGHGYCIALALLEKDIEWNY